MATSQDAHKAGQGGGCFDMWLKFDKNGRPELPQTCPSSQDSNPSRCPSLISSSQDQPLIVSEIIFEGLISKDKGVRRRNQNRASQQAYRNRQRKRLDELQHEIDELKALCMQLEAENRTLSMRYQERWNILLLDLKTELESAERSYQESIGWMLKHAYGSDQADNGRFSVYTLLEKGRPDGPPP